MADAVSDTEVHAGKPPPKRRRILDPSAIVPVPVYSNQVSSGLQLRPMAPVFAEQEAAGDDGGGLWSQFSSRGTKAVVGLSDSEEDEADRAEPGERAAVLCPSPPPPPPETLVQKQSRQVRQKISEIDRRLRAVSSLLSPERRDETGSGRRRGGEDEDEDDVIVMEPDPGSPRGARVREIPLKIRCRTDVHKIPVLSSTPLSEVLARLSVILEVPPPRLLLLREEAELPTGATVGGLGLGIADIIECVVMAAEQSSEADDVLTVRLQSKDRDSSQEFSVRRDAPLGPVFSQYLCGMPPRARRKVRFHFDGSRVTDGQTPAQLDMEDGDIVEVWL